MSNSLMDTEKGGEQTQYEGAHNLSEPVPKQDGQFGDSTGTKLSSQTTTASNEPNTQGVTPADKIRYGQSIQESGMGGKTNASGEANSEGRADLVEQKLLTSRMILQRRRGGSKGMVEKEMSILASEVDV